jgi:arachidonate 15-lipoxygenase
MTPVLPQNDPDSATRREKLNRQRDEYRYDHEILPPIPILAKIPKREKFKLKYQAKRDLRTVGTLANLALDTVRGIFDPLSEVEDFETLLAILPKPNTIEHWRSDEAFAEQRLSGANPMKLRAVGHADHMPFPLPNGNGAGRLPGLKISLDDAIAAGRLYVTDYGDLGFVGGATYKGIQKYLPAPRALYYWSPKEGGTGGQIQPVAIQVKENAPVLSPENTDAAEWLIAKMCVQVADGNDHEMGTHLCWTHFVMEPFGIAIGRHFAENHPLGVLLRPHFRFMMANNELGFKLLINKGGAVERLLSGTLEDSLQICRNKYASWSFSDFAFPTEIKNRGLDSAEGLPHYPYRDDGLLTWNAIESFVTAYVQLYYPEDTTVAEDTELQAWAEELAHPDFGRVKDIPDRILDRSQLSKILTNIVFTCGPQHAAVNFSQYDYMAYVPNMPLAAYCPVGEQGVPVTNDTLMDFLPPQGQAAFQVEIVDALTCYHYDRLGFYDNGDFTDPEALALIQKFQHDLEGIESTIDERNKSRVFPYKFLKPSEILNSISI